MTINYQRLKLFGICGVMCVADTCGEMWFRLLGDVVVVWM